MLKILACSALLAVGAIAATSFAAPVDDLPKTAFKIVGHNSPQLASRDELEFWRNTAPKASNGAITAEVTPVDLAGVNDKALLRLLKTGVMDIAGFDLSKMAGDDPRFEGCDLAGLAASPQDARQACNAYRAVIDQQMQKDWNAKLFVMGGNPPQVLWCRDVIRSLADLKGKKIRVFNNSMRDFVSGFGGTSVNMSFAEVVPALSNGVVDCAVTGSLTGNTSGWTEVSKSIFMMPLGWSINVEAINLDTWNGLDPKVRAFLEKIAKDYEDAMWKTVSTATNEANNCNTNKQPCTLGKLVNLQVVQMTPADKEVYKKLVAGPVLKNWAKRCGAKCTEKWNQSVGKELNVVGG